LLMSLKLALWNRFISNPTTGFTSKMVGIV
jgi:hypothetical protein